MVSYTLCTAAMIGRGLEELCVHDTAKGFFLYFRRNITEDERQRGRIGDR